MPIIELPDCLELSIPADDLRCLIKDLTHRRGALFGSFQVLKDDRQRGRSAVLLDRESGTGNEARPDVDVLYLPHSPNHSIAPSSRPIPASARCVAAGAQVDRRNMKLASITVFGQLR